MPMREDCWEVTAYCSCSYLTFCPVHIHSGSFCSVYIIQAGLFYAISHQRDLQIHRTFRIYAIIFGLTQVVLDDSWPHLSLVGGYQNMTSVIVLFYQLDAQILYFNIFTTFLYMFRAQLCSSSGGQIVLVQHLVSSLSLGGCSVHTLQED